MLCPYPVPLVSGDDQQDWPSSPWRDSNSRGNRCCRCVRPAPPSATIWNWPTGAGYASAIRLRTLSLSVLVI